MPTARELLEQADALMRRNRASVDDADIPELTDVVRESEFEKFDEAAVGAPSITGEPPDSVLVVAPLVPEPMSEPTPETAAEPAPELAPQAAPEPAPQPFPDPLTGIVPQPLAELMPELMPELEPEPAPQLVALVHGDDANAAKADGNFDAERWAALAEEIRMQVLQRIDIFTDTGLKQQLVERLQPVVDRASAELVGTLSQHVGELLRTYVAEAIEREIEKWRQGGH